MGDFNLPDIHWTVMAPLRNDCLNLELLKLVRDNFLMANSGQQKNFDNYNSIRKETI